MSIRILQGDVRERLAELPSDSFDCVVTSPPYWGLRDYGVAGQIGLEPTLTEYLDTMVDVCRELRRVLKPSGVFFLNLGDCYAGSWGNQGRKEERGTQRDINGPMMQAVQDGRYPSLASNTGSLAKYGGLKAKDLCMVPNRLAIRLQEDGWYVRSEIIWAKPNPMPESVTDRPTSSHEKIWLLTKSERYAYDAEAIREPMKDVSLQRLSQPNVFEQEGGPKDTKEGNRSHRKAINNQAERLVKHEKWKTRFEGWNNYDKSLGRNSRNVWEIASQPYSEAHFATFPPELAERCIKAGCPAGGHVLDPFGGAGTTGMVADRLGRDATMIELNPAYVSLIKNRIAEDAGMFAQVAAE